MDQVRGRQQEDVAEGGSPEPVVEKRHSDRRAGKRARKPRQAPASQDFEFGLEWAVSHGELRPEDLPAREPTLLHAAMVTRTELRFRAAEHFLALAKTHLNHETAVLYRVQAFLGAFRSTRELLEKEGRRVPGFEDGYAAKRAEMDAEGLRRLFDLRNESEHEGIQPPNAEFLMEVRHRRDGRKEERLLVERIKLHGVSIEDPIRFFDEAMSVLRSAVVEAKEKRFLTTEHYQDRQVSIARRVLQEEFDGSWRLLRGVNLHEPRIAGVTEAEGRPDLH